MDRQQLNLALTFEALDVQPNLDSFNGRLIVQKAIYLAQAAGHDCGHFFRWYLRGPYSPTLTRDGYAIKSEREAGLDDSASWVLDDTAQERLARVKPLIPTNAKEGDIARHLELLASVHFLVERRQVSDASPAKLVELLKRYDKDFTIEEVECALRDLRDNELLAKW